MPDLKIYIKNGSPFINDQKEGLPTNLFLKNPLKIAHRYFLLQYLINLKKELKKKNYKIEDIHCIYSPLTEYLFQLEKIPQVITCHDLTPLYYPTTNRQKLRYKYLIPKHLKKARKIIAISKFAADQLIENGINSQKIDIIYNGIEVKKDPIKEPFSQNIIVIARHDLNKNVPYVLKGYSSLIQKDPNWKGKIYIVGKEGKQSSIVKKIVNEINNKNIILINQLSYESLKKLMRKSFLLISPSLMEGFNYPIIEAMSMGLPTLISDIPVHKEIYEGSSLFFKMNDDGDDMSDLVLELYKNNILWSDLSNKGFCLAKKFSVKRQQNNIKKILDLY